MPILHHQPKQEIRSSCTRIEQELQNQRRQECNWSKRKKHVMELYTLYPKVDEVEKSCHIAIIEPRYFHEVVQYLEWKVAIKEEI